MEKMWSDLPKVGKYVGSIMQMFPETRRASLGPYLVLHSPRYPVMPIYKYQVEDELVEEDISSEEYFRTTASPGKAVYWKTVKKVVGETNTQFAVLTLENKPLFPLVGSEGLGIHAYIAYYKRDQIIRTLEGRFWKLPNNKRISSMDEADAATEIQKLPNGSTAELLISLKEEGNDRMYGYSTDSNDIDGWMNPEYDLGKNAVHVVVTLRGGNFRDITYMFTLHIRSGNMKIEDIKEWKK